MSAEYEFKALDRCLLSLHSLFHGKSGDIARCEKGPYSVMARDLIENISKVLIREEGKIYEEI